MTIQTQILALLRNLQQTFHLTQLLITHNIAVVANMADEVAVMYLGRIVEQASVKAILQTPKHPYTQTLLAAVPNIGQPLKMTDTEFGELPSPFNPPSGCHYYPRCPHAKPICRQQVPALLKQADGRLVRCWLYPKET